MGDELHNDDEEENEVSLCASISGKICLGFLLPIIPGPDCFEVDNSISFLYLPQESESDDESFDVSQEDELLDTDDIFVEFSISGKLCLIF